MLSLAICLDGTAIFSFTMAQTKDDSREIRTPNLLIWSQTRYHCAMPPLIDDFSQVSVSYVLPVDVYLNTPAMHLSH